MQPQPPAPRVALRMICIQHTRPPARQLDRHFRAEGLCSPMRRHPEPVKSVICIFTCALSTVGRMIGSFTHTPKQKVSSPYADTQRLLECNMHYCMHIEHRWPTEWQLYSTPEPRGIAAPQNLTPSLIECGTRCRLLGIHGRIRARG